MPHVASAAPPSVVEIAADFRMVFGRKPNATELDYWKSRRDDKPQRQELRGAMYSVKAQGKTIGAPRILSSKDLAAAVPRAFTEVFGRAPTTGEKTYWTDRAICGDIPDYKGLIASLGFHKAAGKTIGGGTKEEFCARAQTKKSAVSLNAGLGIGGHGKGPIVRIGIAELKDATITSNGKFFLRLPDNKKKVFAPEDVVKVAYHEGVTVVRGPKGYRAELESPAKLVPIGGAIMEVANYTDRGASGRNYNRFRGTIEVRANSKKTAVWAVNELRTDDYVQGLGETTDNAPEAFQKALAVAARTYVLYHHLLGGRQPQNGFDIGSTANDQIYRGYVYESVAPGFVSQVAATKGQVVTYDGKLIAAVYFSSSDGHTRSAEEVWRSSKFPYLQSKPDPYGGGVRRGHGTGMSGTGAIGFARKDGWDYKKILTYYYTGVKLARGY